MSVDQPKVSVVSDTDPRLPGLISLSPDMGSEQAWLTGHQQVLGPTPQVNRFRKQAADSLSFEKIEVHSSSHQLTVARDSDLLIALFEIGWAPGADEVPYVAVRVPAGWGSVIEPGIWHSGVVAVADTPVMAAFRPRTLEDGTVVHRLQRPMEFVQP